MGSEQQVRALVTAVAEHYKFKQLAVYSLEALAKVPPDVAVDVGAPAAVLKVRRMMLESNTDL